MGWLLSALVLLPVATLKEPLWCQLGEPPVPVSAERLRGFLRSLQSADAGVRTCALQNLEGLSMFNDLLVKVDLEEERAALRAELRAGLLAAFNRDELTTVELQRLRPLCLVRAAEQVDLATLAELKVGLAKPDRGARNLTCELIEPLGVRGAALAAPLRALTAPTGSCLGALVAVDPTNQETAELVLASASAEDDGLRDRALALLWRAPADRPALRVGLVHRALVRHCDGGAISAALASQTTDPRMMDALLDFARRPACPAWLRERALDVAWALFADSSPVQALMIAALTTPDWPALRGTALRLLAEANGRPSPAWSALLAHPTFSPVDVSQFMTHARNTRGAAAPELSRAVDPLLRKEGASWLTELEATARVARVRALRRVLLALPGFQRCRSATAFRVALTVSATGAIKVTKVTPPRHPGARCLKEALAEVHFPPGTLEATLTLPSVIASPPPLLPDADEESVNRRLRFLQQQMQLEPDAYGPQLERLRELEKSLPARRLTGARSVEQALLRAPAP